MEQSTKDQIEGNLHELKGKVKETVGQVTNNSNLAAEGQNEKVAGRGFRRAYPALSSWLLYTRL